VKAGGTGWGWWGVGGGGRLARGRQAAAHAGGAAVGALPAAPGCAAAPGRTAHTGAQGRSPRPPPAHTRRPTRACACAHLAVGVRAHVGRGRGWAGRPGHPHLHHLPVLGALVPQVRDDLQGRGGGAGGGAGGLQRVGCGGL
jgi:hypothetical protein